MTGWHVAFTVSLPVPDWQALVVASRARGLSPSDYAAQVVKQELRRPQAQPWEQGLVAACLRAEPWELSVLPPALSTILNP